MSLKPKKCLGCKEKFIPKTERNIFHNRKCFKRYYYHQKKAEELANSKYPTFKCPSCRNEITLKFDPVKQNFLWLNFVCPYCSVLMISVSEEIVTQEATMA